MRAGMLFLLPKKLLCQLHTHLILYFNEREPMDGFEPPTG